MKNSIKYKHVVLGVSVALLLLCAFSGIASAKTWYVNDDGGYDFTRIQDAIDEALPGDMIFVYNGTYYEDIWISKDNLTIIGEDRDGVSISEYNSNWDFIRITANNTKFGNFTLQDSCFEHGIESNNALKVSGSNNTIFSNKFLNIGSYGHIVIRGSNNTFESNYITKCDSGIGISGSQIKILSNTIEYNNFDDDEAIGLSFTRNIIISNNTIKNNSGTGICLHKSDYDNIISNNIIRDISFKGIELEYSKRTIITNNTIANCSYGINFYGGHSNQIKNNNILMNNLDGIYLGSNNVVADNVIYQNGHNGINSKAGSNNQITNNSISENAEYGIWLQKGENNTITGNEISRNGISGIYLGRKWGGGSVDVSNNNQITDNIVLEHPDYDIGLYYERYKGCTGNTVTNNTARRIHGDLVKNDIYNNIYPRPVINSVNTTTAPTIDGKIEEGEWLNKIEIALNGFADDDHYDGKDNEKLTKTADLYVMNDAENIYIAVVIEDMLREDEDYLWFDFDQGCDFVHSDGDEDMAFLSDYWFDGGYHDFYWNVDDWYTDITSHGMMRRDWSPAERKYVYELRKPLNSGDAQDMKLKAGDTVGFRIEVYDDYSGVVYRFPMDTVDHDVEPYDYHSEDEDIIFIPPVGEESGAWRKWADLITAKEPTPTPQPDLIVEDIWIEPAEFNPGEEVKLYARIKNIGNADAVGKFWWNRYIDGTFINHWYRNGLAAGDSKRTYKRYTWPTDCESHTIKVVVDAKGNITESNEGNNERSERFSATPVPIPTPSPSPTSSPTPTTKPAKMNGNKSTTDETMLLIKHKNYDYK